MSTTEPTYLQQINSEIKCLRVILNHAPFLAAIGASAIAESVTLNVFHIDMDDQPAWNSYGRRQYVTFSRWLSLLRDKKLLPEEMVEIQYRLLKVGNKIRHQHYRPTENEAESTVLDLEQVIGYFRSLVIMMTCGCEKQIRVRVSQYFDQATYLARAKCSNCKATLVCAVENDVGRWSPVVEDETNQITSGMVTVYYGAPGDKGDAQHLANFLTKLLPSVPLKQITLKLARQGQIPVVYMVLQTETAEAVTTLFRKLRRAISVNVFQGAAIELHLCDKDFTAFQILAQ